MTFNFDRETVLTPVGDNRFTAQYSEIYKNPNGAFGGWVAALLAKAVTQSKDAKGPIVSLQVNFLSAVGDSEINIVTNSLKYGASTQFWRAELFQNDALVSSADIVLSNRRKTDLSYIGKAPEFAPRDEGIKLEPMPMTPTWIAHYDQYLTKGQPFRDNKSPESHMWIRETDGRPLDRHSILALCDTPMPRSFFVSDALRMGSTVSMATYIVASDEEIAAAGSDYLKLRVTSDSVRNSAIDQRAELWTESSILLATSSQLAFFR